MLGDFAVWFSVVWGWCNIRFVRFDCYGLGFVCFGRFLGWVWWWS